MHPRAVLARVHHPVRRRTAFLRANSQVLPVDGEASGMPKLGVELHDVDQLVRLVGIQVVRLSHHPRLRPRRHVEDEYLPLAGGLPGSGDIDEVLAALDALEVLGVWHHAFAVTRREPFPGGGRKAAAVRVDRLEGGLHILHRRRLLVLILPGAGHLARELADRELGRRRGPSPRVLQEAEGVPGLAGGAFARVQGGQRLRLLPRRRRGQARGEEEQREHRKPHRWARRSVSVRGGVRARSALRIRP
mmetsp:Transcript_115584/g.331828  ORF Transcript_115584/g.331828 Transcript_115584/m.331828 type:complete len:247 (+) Transcript_115584:645-1385(+)